MQGLVHEIKYRAGQNSAEGDAYYRALIKPRGLVSGGTDSYPALPVGSSFLVLPNVAYDVTVGVCNVSK